MKRLINCLLIAFLLMITFQNFAFSEEKKTVFIYIHGVDQASTKQKKNFYKSIATLHPYIKKELDKNKLFQKNALLDNKYPIDESPRAFYWGNKCRDEMDIIDWSLNISVDFSSKMAQMTRNTLAHSLHDAIWLQKHYNMEPILKNLHKQVMNEANRGNHVVFLAHSAGTFIAYEYFITRGSFLHADEILSKFKLTEKQKDLIKKTTVKKTCKSALVESGLTTLDVDSNFVFNRDIDFEKTYANLDQYTDQYCIPTDSFYGTFNYGTPLLLFYSDLANSQTNLLYYNDLNNRYMIENNIFYIFVNYKEDPLGYPLQENQTFIQRERYFKDNYNKSLTPNKGFSYDKSDIKGHVMFFNAHTSYRRKPKRFAKVLSKVYTEGYSHFYGDKNAPIETDFSEME